MFTGIIESFGKVVELKKYGSNLDLVIQSDISNELKIDQSIAHNGVCLTVVECDNSKHRVTAVQETLIKTNLTELKIGDLLNLERCLKADSRLDGHFVQGHVDGKAICTHIDVKDGSWDFHFEHTGLEFRTVSKGSITINGVSLTVVNSTENSFSVTIIPYTFEHTNFNFLKVGDAVNLEFDILGKYIQQYLKAYLPTAINGNTQQPLNK
jgi:riboflavin synthase